MWKTRNVETAVKKRETISWPCRKARDLTALVLSVEKGDTKSPNAGRSLEITGNGATALEARRMIRRSVGKARGRTTRPRKQQTKDKQARRLKIMNTHLRLKLVTVVIVVRVLITIV